MQDKLKKTLLKNNKSLAKNYSKRKFTEDKKNMEYRILALLCIALTAELVNTNNVDEDMKVRWQLGNEYMTLNLHENNHVTSKVPVVLSRNGVLSRWNSSNEKDFKAYLDPENKAAILVEGSEEGRTSYRGTFRKGEEEFVLNPVTRESSRSKRDTDDVTVDLGDISSIVSIGTDEIPSTYLINDTLGNEDALNLQLNSISSLPINTDQKMYYAVETVIFVDHAIFARWYELAEGATPVEKEDNAINNIRFYFAHVANGLDLHYNSMDEPDFEIYIVLNGIFIAMGPEDSPFVEQHTSYSGPEPYVDGPYALQTFEEWLDTHKQDLPPYDQASLFIGNQMVSYSTDNVRSNLLGFAHVTGMCSYYSASISLDHGYYGSVLIAAHEMGHNLGAFHDGDSRHTESAPCDPQDQYVMAAYLGSTTDETFYNPFSFSSCSVAQFRQFLNVLNLDNANCLLTTAGPVDGNEFDDFLGEKPGQKFTPDQQCQHIYGPRSYHCAGEGNGANICKAMYCFDLVEGDCRAESNIRAADGTTCGNNMWCIGGDCVYDDRAPGASDSCTFGDFKGLLYTGQTCAEMVHDSPWLCYRQPESDKCCSSCERIADENYQICLYGDKASWCEGIQADDCYNPSFETTCCRTCAAFKTSQKGCEYGDNDVNFCSNLPAHKCYAHEKTCCATCAAIDTGNKGCRFGDKTQWCADYIADSPNECYRDNFTCCASCREYRSVVQGCEYGDKIDSCEPWMCQDSHYQEQGLCCATCATGSPTSTIPPVTTSTHKPDPGCTDNAPWCMDYVSKNPGICYDQRHTELCCNACYLQRTSNPECLYGDMYPDCQSDHCDYLAKECCETCKQ